MSDKVAQHPEGSILHHPGGAILMYGKAAQKISPGDFVRANANGNVVLQPLNPPYSMPEALALEEVELNEYSFFLVKGKLTNEPSRSIEIPKS